MSREFHTVSAIDESAWDDAKWRGMLFGTAPPGVAPPRASPIFLDRESAVRIFSGLQALQASSDDPSLLRLSFVSDDRPDTNPGYWIIFGTDPLATITAAIKAQTGAASSISVDNRFRIYRHDCALPSQNLERFKESFMEHGEFDFLPVIVYSLPYLPSDDFDILDDHSLRLTNCVFKSLSSTSEGDVDRMALGGVL
jgi:hypothetical protein